MKRELCLRRSLAHLGHVLRGSVGEYQVPELEVFLHHVDQLGTDSLLVEHLCDARECETHVANQDHQLPSTTLLCFL